MAEQETIAVIGAGVIGSAIACALAREGRHVLLIDQAPPGEAGASFGNAGHIATELVEPLPSPGLLFGFWRELFAFGGVLDIPARRLPPSCHGQRASATRHSVASRTRRTSRRS